MLITHPEYFCERTRHWAPAFAGVTMGELRHSLAGRDPVFQIVSQTIKLCYDESQQLSSTGSFFFYTSLLFCTRPKGDCMLPVAEVPYPYNDNPEVGQKDTLQPAIRGATTM